MIQQRGGEEGEREHVTVGSGVGEATVWGGPALPGCRVAGVPGGVYNRTICRSLSRTREEGQRDYCRIAAKSEKCPQNWNGTLSQVLSTVEWATIFFRTRNQKILLSLPPSTTLDHKAGVSRTFTGHWTISEYRQRLSYGEYEAFHIQSFCGLNSTSRSQDEIHIQKSQESLSLAPDQIVSSYW
ncbi:hypothetical protein G5I_01694 [Acromyrmex echinatior]|uniref:Uncharacterized protein n=1 Tax=Acromyrmex echinatior TaxID=103372 RepID=F4W8B3_ACREC|nr:hypothetical protein G5I_01694 [Acromyrmex echinatior]